MVRNEGSHSFKAIAFINRRSKYRDVPLEEKVSSKLFIFPIKASTLLSEFSIYIKNNLNCSQMVK